MRKLVSSSSSRSTGPSRRPRTGTSPTTTRRWGLRSTRRSRPATRSSWGGDVRGVGVFWPARTQPPPGGDGDERDAEVRRLEDARRGRLAEPRPCSRAISPRRSERSRRSPARTSACRGAPRSCGRCSRIGSSTSCGCSCIRSSSGREGGCSRTASGRCRSSWSSRARDRRPRPRLPTGGRVSGRRQATTVRLVRRPATIHRMGAARAGRRSFSRSSLTLPTRACSRRPRRGRRGLPRARRPAPRGAARSLLPDARLAAGRRGRSRRRCSGLARTRRLARGLCGRGSTGSRPTSAWTRSRAGRSASCGSTTARRRSPTPAWNAARRVDLIEPYPDEHLGLPDGHAAPGGALRAAGERRARVRRRAAAPARAAARRADPARGACSRRARSPSRSTRPPRPSTAPCSAPGGPWTRRPSGASSRRSARSVTSGCAASSSATSRRGRAATSTRWWRCSRGRTFARCRRSRTGGAGESVMDFIVSTGKPSLRHVVTRAGGQPAVAWYIRGPGSRPSARLRSRRSRERVGRSTPFADPRLFLLLGLPAELA